MAPVDSVAAEVARVREALARWITEPASEEALTAVRHRLIGGFPLQFETLGGLIAQWMAAALNGLPHMPQSRKPSGFSWPHCRQRCTTAFYGGRE